MQIQRIIYAALIGNGLIAVSKLAIGIISGSVALLAEAAHSVADTFNQVFLLISLRLSKRPADLEHPFGHGKERFFWAFITAIILFVVGAFFSIFEGAKKIVAGELVEPGHFVSIYVALGLAFVFELVSLGVAFSEVKHLIKEEKKPLFQILKTSKDPTTKTVLAEDTAALLGVVIAAIGTYLMQTTKSSLFDGAASILIGIILLVVAFVLAQQSRGLLLGEAASTEDRQKIRETILSHPQVRDVIDLLTMHLAPDEILVNSHLSFKDGLETGQIEKIVDEIEMNIRRVVPEATHIFIEAETGQISGKNQEQGK